MHQRLVSNIPGLTLTINACIFLFVFEKLTIYDFYETKFYTKMFSEKKREKLTKIKSVKKTMLVFYPGRRK